MKAGKAYITSLGTTGLLVASSVMLLVVVGALMAFDGWPSSEAHSPPETVAIDGGDTKRVVARRRIARERRALAESGRRGSRRAGAARRSSRSRSARPDTTGVVISPLPAPDTRPGGGGTGGGNGSPGGDAPARAGAGSGVVGEVGDTVSGVSPQAGGTIGQTGDTVGDAVEEVVPVTPSLVGGSQVLP